MTIFVQSPLFPVTRLRSFANYSIRCDSGAGRARETQLIDEKTMFSTSWWYNRCSKCEISSRGDQTTQTDESHQCFPSGYDSWVVKQSNRSLETYGDQQWKHGSGTCSRLEYLQLRSINVEMETSWVRLVLDARQMSSFIKLERFKLVRRSSLCETPFVEVT